MDRHSKLQQGEPRVPLSAEEEARQAARNGLRQFDFLAAEIRRGIEEYDRGEFRLKPSTLQKLCRLAVEGMVDGPGHYRRVEIGITGARHTPPTPYDVAELVEKMCDYVNNNWSLPATELAAYVMWRLNWIHPFEDGNGRTSRTASYLVLCVRSRHEWPGTPSIPEIIANDKQPYYEALEAADRAHASGKRIDVSVMRGLLERALLEQVLSVTATSADGSTERHTRVVNQRASTFNPAPAEERRNTQAFVPRHAISLTILATVLAAIIYAAATLLASDAGQRMLGCAAKTPGATPTAPTSVSPTPSTPPKKP